MSHMYVYSVPLSKFLGAKLSSIEDEWWRPLWREEAAASEVFPQGWGHFEGHNSSCDDGSLPKAAVSDDIECAMRFRRRPNWDRNQQCCQNMYVCLKFGFIWELDDLDDCVMNLESCFCKVWLAFIFQLAIVNIWFRHVCLPDVLTYAESCLFCSNDESLFCSFLWLNWIGISIDILSFFVFLRWDTICRLSFKWYFLIHFPATKNWHNFAYYLCKKPQIIILWWHFHRFSHSLQYFLYSHYNTHNERKYIFFPHIFFFLHVRFECEIDR